MTRKSHYLSDLASKKLPQVNDWVHDTLRKIAESGIRPLILAFSLSPRRFSKEKNLVLEIHEQDELCKTYSSFNLWNEQNFARIVFLQKIGEEFPEVYKDGLDQIFSTASLEEQSFLLRILNYLPHPDFFISRACEGIRSNSTAVFDAIVLDNPYPEKYLNDHSWNQMVLKAVFIGRPLYRIVGIDSRMNEELALMLKDLVKERSAANRKITPEAWRLLGAYLEADMHNEVQKMASGDDILERMAAILACCNTKTNLVQIDAPENASLLKDINDKKITWDRLGKMYAEENERNN